ncbi:MAG: hypothetical protein JO112_20935 [Planctomycetes bacterium]|nr:hypothetical protein [Planctomycetota bacterium]
MPDVRLGRREMEKGDLPPVCLRCGAPTDYYQRRTFHYLSPGLENVFALLGGVPAVLIASLAGGTHNLKARVPLCGTHRFIWRLRNLLYYGGPFVLLFLFAGFMVAMSLENAPPGHPGQKAGEPSPVSMGFGCVLLPLALLWAVYFLYYRNSFIRVVKMTENSITLRGLSRIFIEELEEQDEEDIRPRKRPRPRPKTSRKDDLLEAEPEDYEDE